jgi:hypothetical protein
MALESAPSASHQFSMADRDRGTSHERSRRAFFACVWYASLPRTLAISPSLCRE